MTASSIRTEATARDDSTLIDESLRGNTAAFGELVERYQDRLYNTLVHVTGSPEDARDIAQDAFVQVLLKLGNFQRQSAFYTWLYRIALNLAISGRRRKRATASVDELRTQTGCEPAAGGDAPEEPAERAERAVQVRGALAAISEEFRTVAVLRDIEGYSYEEIATMLDVPVGTVRSRIHRARILLRERLQEVVE